MFLGSQNDTFSSDNTTTTFGYFLLKQKATAFPKFEMFEVPKLSRNVTH